ncbi:hypothetical protein E0K83_04000 [Gramella sp. BOM4]|nr:hypothetical protein [Christiangramia bathymodioli]
MKSNFTTRQESEPFEISPLFKPETEFSEYITGEPQENESGMTFVNHYRNLNPSMFGIFHGHTIKNFLERPNQNHFYEGRGLNSQADLVNLKKLVNAFFVKFGTDDNGLGGFSKEDILDIKEDFWVGRKWISSKHKHPAMISYTIEEGVQLTIWQT